MGRKTKPLAAHILQDISIDQKPDAAQDDQGRHRQDNGQVRPVHHYGEVVGEQGKPGVVESRDRMENPEIEGTQESMSKENRAVRIAAPIASTLSVIAT